MKTEDYIASGILESYVLGQLNKQDSAAVEKMAAKNPRVKKEISLIEDTFNAYAMAHSKSPRPELKENILAKLDEKRISNEAKIVDLNKRRPISLFLVAASLTLAIISSAAAVFYWQKYNNTRQQLTALQADNIRLAENHNVKNNNDTLSLAYAKLKSKMDIMNDTNTVCIHLKGLTLSPASKVLVLWKKETKEVFVDVRFLPIPPSDMQYQLWAMEDGKPVDAGVFNLSDLSNLQKMKTIQVAQAFAITLEKSGGSDFPTLDNMYVMGKVY